MASTTPLHVVLVGGSGFVGRELRQRLVARGDAVTVIDRGPSATYDGWTAVSWDATTAKAPCVWSARRSAPWLNR